MMEAVVSTQSTGAQTCKGNKLFIMQSKNFSIKFEFKGETRRIGTNLEELTWQSLEGFIKSVFKHHSETTLNSLIVCYVDDEGDKCTISSDEELAEAVRLAQPLERRSLLKIVLECNEEPKSPSHGWDCPRGAVNERASQLCWEGLNLMKSGDLVAAKAKFEEQAKLYRNPRRTATPMYNIACCEALLGDVDSAFLFLKKASDAGFNDVEHMRNDDDLKSLRNLPRFHEFIQQIAASSPVEHGGRCPWRNGGRSNEYCSLQNEAFQLMERRTLDDLNKAIELLTKQADLAQSQWHRRIPVYNIACCHALLGNKQIAMTLLQKAVDLGYHNVRHMENDSDLDSLRNTIEFQQLISSLKERRDSKFSEFMSRIQDYAVVVSQNSNQPGSCEEPSIWPQNRYGDLVNKIMEMGFHNYEEVLMALDATSGNYEEAVQFLVNQ
eukprot:TRINITY_DN110_c0_g1_i4.p1 TRINITY_DN110_c0_g1~~TRINITY_DN110_c0_g1_i4.p1  ORF type:complete len:438 (-),score=74.49 TRINITY_DN110_c0_g1_i4:63-1376(-)